MASTTMKIVRMEAIVRWCVLVSTVILLGSTSNAGEVRELSEDDWTEMLEGEWLVKFYAPWCPACQSLAKMWVTVAEQVHELNVQVAKVDVTKNPALSGRFFVTALPTIFHVKDGVFRHYKQGRSEQVIYKFISETKWQDVEPLPWYQSPTSLHMSFLGMFFRFSMAIRDLHTTMMSEYGIPVWGSYVVFAVATILLGLFIGLLIVCLCDLRQPARTYSSVDKKRIQLASGDVKSSQADDSDLPDDGDEDDKQSKVTDKTQNSEDKSESNVRHREAKSSDD